MISRTEDIGIFTWYSHGCSRNGLASLMSVEFHLISSVAERKVVRAEHVGQTEVGNDNDDLMELEHDSDVSQDSVMCHLEKSSAAFVARHLPVTTVDIDALREGILSLALKGWMGLSRHTFLKVM